MNTNTNCLWLPCIGCKWP